MLAFQQVTKEINRVNNLLNMFNHSLLKGDDFYGDKIKEINVRAIVIHGKENTILPFAHALALVDELPNSLDISNSFNANISTIKCHSFNSG